MAQRVALPGLPDAVALAQAFQLNDGPVHHLTITLQSVAPTNYALPEPTKYGKNQQDRCQIPSQAVGLQASSVDISGYYSSFVLLEVFSVGITVAICAKRDQIFGGIVAKRTARTNMVYLKLFRGSATLASPTIPLEDIVTKLVIGISVESKPRLSLPH